MAVTAMHAPRVTERSGSPRLAALLSACAAVLCVSVVAIIVCLAAASITAWPKALHWYGQQNVFQPIWATLYVTFLALPLAALVGILAAIAVSDARIFGSTVTRMRTAIAILGGFPTVVSAVAAAIALAALHQRPTLTAAAIALAFINMPLMTALATAVLAGGTPDLREVATALGASPTYVVQRVLLPGSSMRLGAAVIIVATQMIGGAAAIALITGTIAPGGMGWAPVGAWPLAVDVWAHGADTYRFGESVTAAGALILTVAIWLLQGAAMLRQAPSHDAQESR